MTESLLACSWFLLRLCPRPQIPTGTSNRFDRISESRRRNLLGFYGHGFDCGNFKSALCHRVKHRKLGHAAFAHNKVPRTTPTMGAMTKMTCSGNLEAVAWSHCMCCGARTKCRTAFSRISEPRNLACPMVFFKASKEFYDNLAFGG